MPLSQWEPTVGCCDAERCCFKNLHHNQLHRSFLSIAPELPFIPVVRQMRERYYTSLLVNDAGAFLKSHTTRWKREDLWREICTRFHPDHPLVEDGEGDNAQMVAWHFRIHRFISLILEESRHAIAEALYKRWGQPTTYPIVCRDGLTVRIEFDKTDETEGDKKGQRPATRRGRQCRGQRGIFYENELFQAPNRHKSGIRHDLMRPGTIVELVPVQRGYPNISQVEFGMISHQVWIGKDIHREKKAITLYNKNSNAKTGLYSMHPLTSLLSSARQIEACCYLNPRLYPALLGDASIQTEETEEVKNPPANFKEATDDPASSSNTIAASLSFDIPQMNDCQQEASTAFLRSPRGTIELVQGPPGTGKTTMLTATICRFLVDRIAAGVAQPRLMVCAPSNKAVTVLAARYLKAENKTSSVFRAAMVGDRDKMLSEDRLRFKDIFVYDWLSNMTRELHRLCGGLSWKNRQQRRTEVEALSTKLFENVPDHILRSKRGSHYLMKAVLEGIDTCVFSRLDKALEDLTKHLQANERAIQSELLRKANVLFCTLSSAGTSIVKMTESIEGLIIDEAAAAIEPETFIPMALGPERIMIVGDPKQLPATILSQQARDLSKSLQERLMFDERRPYTMLDVQYRMKPEISKFPSATFYDGRLSNGPNVMCPSYKSPMHCSLFRKQPYNFIEVDGIERQAASGSFENILEAQVVVSLLKEVRTCAARRDPRWAHIDKIRVITFYSAQVELIGRMTAAYGLKQIAVSTVDSSQGSEADLILISFVRTGKAGTIGFLSDDRRLNVAMTRAKHQLICIGNAAHLAHTEGRKAAVIRCLVEDTESRQVLHSTYRPCQSLLIWAPPTHSLVPRKRPLSHPQATAKATKRSLPNPIARKRPPPNPQVTGRLTKRQLQDQHPQGTHDIDPQERSIETQRTSSTLDGPPTAPDSKTTAEAATPSSRTRSKERSCPPSSRTRRKTMELAGAPSSRTRSKDLR